MVISNIVMAEGLSFFDKEASFVSRAPPIQTNKPSKKGVVTKSPLSP